MKDYLGGQGSWLHLTNLGGGRSLGSHNSAASTCAPVDVSRQTTATSCSPVKTQRQQQKKRERKHKQLVSLWLEHSSEKRRIFKKLVVKRRGGKMIGQTSCCLLLLEGTVKVVKQFTNLITKLGDIFRGKKSLILVSTFKLKNRPAVRLNQQNQATLNKS